MKRRPSETRDLPHDIDDLAEPPRHAQLHGGTSMAMRKSSAKNSAKRSATRKKGTKVPPRRRGTRA